MIYGFLSRLFSSKDEKAERDRIQSELSALKKKAEQIEWEWRKSQDESYAVWGRERELKNWISLPADDCISPRDGSQLLKSDDTMFVAMLLHRSKGRSKILEMRDQGGQWCYLPEMWEPSKSLKARGAHIVSTLRLRFKETFLRFRSAISSREISPHDFMIGGNILREAECYGDKKLWKFGAGLVRPFDPREDSLLEGLHEVGFFDWLSEGITESPSLKHGEVFCPLDGPVVPIKASEKTPPHSWEIMCGREWALYLCPKCLGTFERRMTKMN